MPETTPQSGSLDDAARAITERFSAKPEEQPPERTQPEPTPAKPEESEQAPPAPPAVPEGSEEADAGATTADDAETQPPQKFTVKVDGQDVEATLDDLLKSYSFTEHNTRKSQTIAEERKALEAERQKFQAEDVATVRAERSQYGEYLAQLKTYLDALSPKEPNWEERRNALPADEFAAELLTWQVNQKRIEGVKSEQARIAAQQDAEAMEGFTKHVQSETAKLAEAIPAFKDPVQAKTLTKTLREFGMSHYGFTAEQFDTVADHRLVRLIHDAYENHQSKAKAPEIKNKIEKALAASAPGSRTTAPPKNELAAAKARAKSSGSTEDAAAALALAMKG